MKLLTEAIELLNSGEFDKVIDMISSFLDENPEYKTIDYHHFANPLQETLFEEFRCK